MFFSPRIYSTLVCCSMNTLYEQYIHSNIDQIAEPQLLSERFISFRSFAARRNGLMGIIWFNSERGARWPQRARSGRDSAHATCASPSSDAHLSLVSVLLIENIVFPFITRIYELNAFERRRRLAESRWSTRALSARDHSSLGALTHSNDVYRDAIAANRSAHLERERDRNFRAIIFDARANANANANAASHCHCRPIRVRTG